jgi:hypothetical protein
MVGALVACSVCIQKSTASLTRVALWHLSCQLSRLVACSGYQLESTESTASLERVALWQVPEVS